MQKSSLPFLQVAFSQKQNQPPPDSTSPRLTRRNQVATHDAGSPVGLSASSPVSEFQASLQLSRGSTPSPLTSLEPHLSLSEALRQAIAFQRQGQFKQAHAILDALPQNNSRVILARGRCYEEEGKYVEAYETYLSGPDDPTFLLTTGRCLQKMGEHRKALSIYDKMNQTDQILLTKGRCYQEISEYDLAHACFLRMKEDLDKRREALIYLQVVKKCSTSEVLGVEKSTKKTETKKLDIKVKAQTNRAAGVSTEETKKRSVEVYAFDFDECLPVLPFYLGEALQNGHRPALIVYQELVRKKLSELGTRFGIAFAFYNQTSRQDDDENHGQLSKRASKILHQEARAFAQWEVAALLGFQLKIEEQVTPQTLLTLNPDRQLFLRCFTYLIRSRGLSRVSFSANYDRAAAYLFQEGSARYLREAKRFLDSLVSTWLDEEALDSPLYRPARRNRFFPLASKPEAVGIAQLLSASL